MAATLPGSLPLGNIQVGNVTVPLSQLLLTLAGQQQVFQPIVPPAPTALAAASVPTDTVVVVKQEPQDSQSSASSDCEILSREPSPSHSREKGGGSTVTTVRHRVIGPPISILMPRWTLTLIHCFNVPLGG